MDEASAFVGKVVHRTTSHGREARFVLAAIPVLMYSWLPEAGHAPNLVLGGCPSNQEWWPVDLCGWWFTDDGNTVGVPNDDPDGNSNSEVQ